MNGSVSTGDTARNNGIKLQQGRFKLCIRKSFLTVKAVKCWTRLPREAMEAPSLKVFKCRLSRYFSGIVWKGMSSGWTKRSIETPRTCFSVILYIVL